MDTDIDGRVIESALTLAAASGWHRLSLSRIATAADLPIGQLYHRFPSKTAILRRLITRTDATVLAGTPVWTDHDSARDRLFDVLMRRFDALAPYRPGLATVVRDLPASPLVVCEIGAALNRAMAWMLVAADIEFPGFAGRVQAVALTGIYLFSLRVWLTDPSSDQARTMAALDTSLRRAETVIAQGRLFR